MAAVLHQIYYGSSQRDIDKRKSKLYHFSIPYFNEGLTIFFENSVISQLVKETTAEKIAVCSWKLSEKIRRAHKFNYEVLNTDYQIISFTVNSTRHQMMAMSAAWHPNFIETIDLLWSKLGYKRPLEAKNPMYKNYYSAKTDIYRDYVTNFLDPAMEMSLKDEQLHTMMIAHSGYGRLSSESDLPAVKAKLGMTDYPMAPFILERCPALFYQMKGYRISYLPQAV